MKIATYNVNGINGRLPVLLRWLKETKPDIACLQELKSPNEKFPVEALTEAGYEFIYHGQKSWNGVAILSRVGLPREVRNVLPGDPEDDHSRYLECELNGLIIVCIYLPNGNPAPGPKFEYKLAWFTRLQAHAKKLIALKKPVIICGDFNVIPEDIDAYKPERWVRDAVFFPESREAYRKLLAQGWTDAVRSLYPQEKIFTYWDYFRDAFSGNAGIRMDHFLLSDELQNKLRKAGVDTEVRGWEKTSDHAPVWIDLK